jgi:hypothetical protein
MDILRLKGHVLKGKTTPTSKEGILENRWATNIDDLFAVLQNDTYKKLGALPFLNSWGTIILILFGCRAKHGTDS